MATSALLYTFSSLIASLVGLINVLLVTSDVRVGDLLAALSFMWLLGAVGWIMALPALVALALGLYRLSRSPSTTRADARLDWLLFGAGTALFAVTVPVVLVIATSRTFDVSLPILQNAIGLASGLLLLGAAVLPALRRGSASRWAPARFAVLVGIVAAGLEGTASVAWLAFPGVPIVANWPPLAWGFPAAFLVLASAFLLFWAYSAMRTAAQAVRASPGATPLTGVP